jgi:DinB superfamily
MELAFGEAGVKTDESQALLQNLTSVPEQLWRALPNGAARTIESMVLHVGSCKVMYADYAFHEGTLDWADRQVQPWREGEAPMAEALEWLAGVHGQLVSDVGALADDGELDRLRPTNWGEEWLTRSIIGAMITHDSYHAGEINHIRSLLNGDDRWFYVQHLVD